MDANKPQSIVHQLVRTPRAVSNQMRRCNVSLKRISNQIASNSSWLSTNRSNSKNTDTDSLENCLAYINVALEVSSRNVGNENPIRLSGSGDIAPIKPTRRPSSNTSLTSVVTSDTTSCNHNALFAQVDVMPEKPIRQTQDPLPLPDSGGCVTKNFACLPLHTINQNDFMIQCLIDTSRPCLVHFYVGGSSVSIVVDRELGELHGQSFQKSGSSLGCRFMRISASAAPFITSKLQISSQDPSIVCIHNGEVFQRMIDPECYSQFPGAVQQWARDTGLLDL